MTLLHEWPVRRSVLDLLLKALEEGQPRSARQLVTVLETQGLRVPKRLVNSVLFSEGRRYVLYDKKSHMYTLRATGDGESSDDVREATYTEPSTPLTQSDGSTDVSLKVRYLGRQDQFSFHSARSTTPAFFDVVVRGAEIRLVLNQDHPIYSSLSGLFDPPVASVETVLDQEAEPPNRTLEWLLIGWARYEYEQPAGSRRRNVELARADWGRALRDLMTGNDE